MKKSLLANKCPKMLLISENEYFMVLSKNFELN
jgi:hypothetical protein